MNRHLFCACCLVSVVLGIYQAVAGETSAYLPVGRSWVQDDKSLPIPCGFGVNYYYQRQGYDMNKLDISSPVIPNIGQQFNIVPSTLDVKSRVNEVNIKLDTWLLPFLNLFAIAGRVEQVTKIRNIPAISELQYEDKGNLYGGGATAVYGYKFVWASVTIADSYAALDMEDSWINAVVVTPKVGVRVDTPWPGKGLNVWVGGVYQNVDEQHTGTWDIQGIAPITVPVRYDAKLKEKEPWNVVAGLGTDLWGRVALEVEAGTGEREQLLTSLSYRF